MPRKYPELMIALVSILFIGSLYQLSLMDRHPVPAVHAREFTEWVSQHHPVIIDLRESSERARHPLAYQPALHLPFVTIFNHLQQIPVDAHAPTLLVCSDGNRARLIAYLLNERGIRVYYLAEGLNSL
jgi:rhodanese-related sulfurtransferase